MKRWTGAGLRPPHYPELLERTSSAIGWFEIITENFLTTKGRPRWVLEQLRKDYPLAFHGVSLSIGSPEPLDLNYLHLLRALIQDFEPFLVSDHFCWTGLRYNNTHNLLPLELSRATLEKVTSRIHQVQECLGRTILLENASAYLQMTGDEMTEWDFISQACQRTGCGLLLDINNLYVTSTNFAIDPFLALAQVPRAAVGQIHLAGYSDRGNYLFDTHSRVVQKPVWDLFEEWLRQDGPFVPSMIEWDDDIPPLVELEQEVSKIQDRMAATKSNTSARKDPTCGL